MHYGGVLIKPVSGRCQLACRYCFYHEEQASREVADRGIMNPEVQEKVVREVLADADAECTIAFQGGEPTLAGLDFYRRWIELQRTHNYRRVRISNALQTNGLLLDEAWCDFLAEHHFLVGLSLDGDRLAHDLNRVDRSGAGTYERVRQAARLMRDKNVDFNILCVVTDALASRARTVYRELRRNGFDHLQFIPCLDDPGRPAGDVRAPALSAEVYGTFLICLFDAWEDDLKRGETVRIRLFDNWLMMLRQIPPEACGMIGYCTCIPTIEADGSIYPCDFYALDPWRLGQIGDMPLSRMLSSPTARRFVRESRQVDPTCVGCRFHPLCRGGCRRDRGDDLGLNRLCTAYQLFLDQRIDRLEVLADRRFRM